MDLLDIWDIVQKQVEQFTPEYSYACEMNCKRARFTLLTQMSLNGYDHDDSLMKKTKQQLKKRSSPIVLAVDEVENADKQKGIIGMGVYFLKKAG